IFNHFDVLEESELVQLFQSCSSGAGYITSEGWQFLFLELGAETLLSIYQHWVNGMAPMEGLILLALKAGYHPIHNEYGDYDEAEGYFITLNGFKFRVDWEEIRKYNQ
ncbi:MAG: hypothetical protein MUE81_15130, partial [Thermoflexibacter sp.]|nr:hypothetical protein [Thermoflexibacter sp.]